MLSIPISHLVNCHQWASKINGGKLLGDQKTCPSARTAGKFAVAVSWVATGGHYVRESRGVRAADKLRDNVSFDLTIKPVNHLSLASITTTEASTRRPSTSSRTTGAMLNTPAAASAP